MDTETAPLWELVGISKSYPGVRANKEISLSLHSGEIHALLGENGCGKSTLIKLVAGVHQPDPGSVIELAGEVRPADPAHARFARRCIRQSSKVRPAALHLLSNEFFGYLV